MAARMVRARASLGVTETWPPPGRVWRPACSRRVPRWTLTPAPPMLRPVARAAFERAGLGSQARRKPIETTVAQSSVATVRWATIRTACSPSQTFMPPSSTCPTSSSAASSEQTVARAPGEGDAEQQDDRERRRVDEDAVGEVDVGQAVVPEGQELAVAAGRELVAAGEMGARDVRPDLVDAPLLGPGHVAAGDDRAEQEHRGRRPRRASARGPARGPARSASTAASERALKLSQSSRPKRIIAVPRWAATSPSLRLCSTVSPPSPAWTRTSRPAAMLPRKAQPLRFRRSRYARQQSSAIRTDNDRRQQPVRELDERVLVADERDHVAAAERPSLGPAAAEAAAQPGVADANDPADDDQQEGDNSGEVCQAAKPAEPCTAAARTGSGHAVRLPALASRPARRGSASRRRTASRMSRSGSSLRTSGTTSKLCGRRRRGGEPLERLAAPGIVAGADAAA